MLKYFCRFWLWVFRWKSIYNFPKEPRYVIIAYPHTSNWDFPLGIFYIIGSGIPFRYMGKDALFKWPQKYLFKALGGFAVDRSKTTSLTSRMAEFINSQDKIALALSPEGTRSNIKYWRTGFYYIALEAKVPIALATLDYENREVGIRESFMPTGDIDVDIEHIKNFFKNFKGKHPKKQGPIQIKKK